MKKTNEKMKRFLEMILRPELRILPGHLAFFIVLSLIPIITLVVYFASVFAVSTDTLVGFVESLIPKQISDLLMPYLLGKGISISIGLSMIVAFFVASNGAYSIIIASNTLYKIKGTSYIKGRIKAFFMTIILVLLVIFMMLIFAYGNNILNFIFGLGILKNFSKTIYIIYFILKWTLALFIMFCLIKLLYTMAPNHSIKSKYMNKGALFTTVAFVLVSVIYSYYVTNFANYNVIYGSLSSIVMLMIFIYILSYIFVLGIIINTSTYELENNDGHKI